MGERRIRRAERSRDASPPLSPPPSLLFFSPNEDTQTTRQTLLGEERIATTATGGEKEGMPTPPPFPRRSTSSSADSLLVPPPFALHPLRLCHQNSGSKGERGGGTATEGGGVERRSEARAPSNKRGGGERGREVSFTKQVATRGGGANLKAAAGWQLESVRRCTRKSAQRHPAEPRERERE